MITCYYLTNKGLVRKINQDTIMVDSLVFSKEERILDHKFFLDSKLTVGVFDGVGGLSEGEVASEYVAQYLSKTLAKSREITKENLFKSFKKVNEGLVALRRSESKPNSCTTMAMINMLKKDIYCSNVGDSRIYSISFFGKKITQLYTPDKNKEATNEHEILNCFGLDEFDEYSVHVNKIKRKPFTYYVLMSDGISDFLSIEDIRDIIKHNRNIKKSLLEIEKKVLAEGARDNLSVIIMRNYL
jgi:protein phosphatase